ncbi:hypothetical protein EXE46_13965 [Halorubrum sp. GN11_10-6_MGM]|uniref:DUF7511 domain-containing protein n=1 Tax=Halorubrum sp. GN11_10-6_MGM TaxID=2518112 RepID=UPI0010F94BFD|nr:hypothetical protein [Halorubrum sp. GN11_10-6_MGM]TKX73503.1 hypothetical protein EXE46_13965 [Halorubrum sp. GN11_10-6_MGM]
MSTSTSSARARDGSPELVCKRTDDGDGDGEVTFFERDVDPDERTTRWITVRESDCVPRDEWR